MLLLLGKNLCKMSHSVSCSRARQQQNHPAAINYGPESWERNLCDGKCSDFFL